MISDTEDESYGINMEASICISMKGHHYINSLIFEFPYIELILQDTPIFDSAMFEEIKNSFPLAYNNGKRDLRMRVEVVEKFLAYLEYTEKCTNIIGVNYYDKNDYLVYMVFLKFNYKYSLPSKS